MKDLKKSLERGNIKLLKKSIENLKEIVSLSEEEIEKNDKNISAVLDLEDLKSLKEVLDNIKENELDLTTVYLKGVYDGKEKASIDQSICKERMAEDALIENVKLKKELYESIPKSKINEIKNNIEARLVGVINSSTIHYTRYTIQECISIINVLEQILKMEVK